MTLEDGTLLQGGKYKIVRFLSSGGFGNTYEGVHTMMDTRVAIKEFFPKMFCNRDESTSNVTVATQGNRELVDKLRKKFNEEAKAVFQMNHPNIVRVLDIFEENSTAYYVMEYIDGKSLNDITKERGALPESEAVDYILQVADALKYVHSLNRLHLDIKPGNIMVDKNGKAILIDFGASKHYDDESGENTSTLMGVNTKGYAPIEQSTQSFTSFSPATDIYALGATFYKLLTGITPPDANLLLGEEETLQPLPATISNSTRNAVVAAMQLRRKNRPQSVDEFLLTLKSNVTYTAVNTFENDDDESTAFLSTLEQKEENQRTKEPQIEVNETKETASRNTSNLIEQTPCREIISEPKKEKSSKKIITYGIIGVFVFCLFFVALRACSLSASLEDGIAYYENKEYDKAFPILLDLAEEGNVDAQNILGLCYEDGLGVQKDARKAVEWYTKSAEQGNAIAQYNLGKCYENGKGIKKDVKKAAEFYTKSAEQGDAVAQCDLGFCYSNGIGVQKDARKAVEWYTKSAEQGDAVAQRNLGNSYRLGEGVQKDARKAVEWYTKSAEQGDACAQCNLGNSYQLGEGVQKDARKGVEWYTKSAEQGYADAQFNLGLCYQEGIGIQKDTKKAVEWYTKSAEQGHADAQCNLGYCYYSGKGVKKDLKKAKEWYDKAAKQGSEEAINALNGLSF